MANEQFDSVWDALADSPDEASDLKARSELMMQITNCIKSQGWNLAEAAERCGTTEQRIQGLLDGHIAKFDLNDLLAIATASNK
jgi:predicted XRE-type DNA-binding protein